MVFRDEDKFVRYRIIYSDRKKVAEMVLDKAKEITFKSYTAKSSPKSKIEQISDRDGVHINSYYQNYQMLSGYLVKSISSREPYTISVTSEALSYRDRIHLGPEEDFINRMEKSKYASRLANVLHSNGTLESLLKIIETLETNREVLEAFYKEYQTDLLALKEMLPYIILKEEETVPFIDQQQKIERMNSEIERISKSIGLGTEHPKTSLSNYPHAMKRIDEIKAQIGDWPQELALAEENTKIAKTLNLQFKKLPDYHFN